ncbi:hypothetical protein [Streptomyces sp. Ag109_O5-10]|uniref:hypothetical protein n=1 Tax=Streptomyces sp. Ag109_O5-10 TaxID=1855349 RepID=UPI0008947711|nr:hypothetical protein [Streptomyces sp. Ag109_O5-10]SEE77299.1 hypothetical protein SAMN05216533_3630 [Streptomyces sp. Ag109_O5-10]
MKRRTLLATAALAASAALLLAACSGGDGGSKANDKIAGADSGGTKASASPTASAAADRPKVTLPNDLTDTFESWKTGDTTKDAVLGDVARRIDATNYAIAQGDPELPALSFYYSGGALADAKDWVESIAKDGYSITGVNRYYSAKIDVFDSASAGVAYCEDQSKAFAKVRKSGKVIKTAVNDDSYVVYTTRLEKNKQGVWQTTKLTSQRGSKSCTP